MNKIGRLALIIIVLLLTGTFFVDLLTAHAAPAAPTTTLVVTNLNNCCSGSLRNRINNANPGDIITFAVSGTIVLNNELLVDTDVTISGTLPITISGNNATGVFSITANHVTLANLTIVNGRSEGGAGIYNAGGTLTVTNSIIRGNDPGDFGLGVGIYNNTGTLIVTNSTIQDNKVGLGFGGGIFNNTGTVIITNSTIRDNNISSSSSRGGGIYNNTGTLMVTNSTLSGNNADEGGGIYNAGGPVIINNSTFNDNSAYGSTIYGIGAVTITNSTFSGNTGSYIIRGQILTIDSSTISNNGSGILLTASYGNRESTIRDSTISGNTFAIRNLGASRVRIVNSTISGNSGRYSSIVNWQQGQMIITNSTIAGNSATTADFGGGGGISNDSATAMLTVTNSTIRDNTGVTAGGINVTAGTVFIANSTLSGNTGPNGGGIGVESGTVTINNSTLSGNTATASGGGIEAVATVWVNNSTVVSNSAPLGAGLAIKTGGSVRLRNSIFTDNAGGDCANDGGSFTSNWHNLDSDGSCGSATTGDPQLGPLQDNGGPTLTHMPALGSPAIDGGNNNVCLALDSRDVVRPQAGTCDIGALELVTAPPVITMSISALSAADGQLVWDNPHPVCHSDIYEEATPFTFSPTAAYQSVIAPYTVTARLGDSGNNYFYLTRVRCDGMVIDSNWVGEFDFALSPAGDPLCSIYI